MILVDTSVWIDHLRQADRRLAASLDAGAVLVHPFVIGEVALGHVRSREVILRDLHDLPSAPVASREEVLHLIGQHRLFGRGIGYVDAHLLATARVIVGTTLWTHDKHLRSVAAALGLAYDADQI